MSDSEAKEEFALRVARRVPEMAVLEHVVAELREIERRTGIERTLAIGELVLNQFFGGDPAAWRDRRRNKNNSIRRLAERADCPFCRSALNEAGGVYVAVGGPPCVRTFGHVCASHVASVLRLTPIERQQILSQAEQERWSVRELRQRVVHLRRSEGERRGRPSKSTEARALSAFGTGVSNLTRVARRLSTVHPLSSSSRATLAAMAEEVSALHELLLDLAAGPGTVRRPAPELRLRERSA